MRDAIVMWRYTKMVVLVALLGTQSTWQAQCAAGVTMRLRLYAADVIALIEHGMLTAATEGKQRDG